MTAKNSTVSVGTSEISNLKSTNRILVAILIIASFFLGSLTNKVATLEKKSSDTVTQTQGPTSTPQPSVTIDKIKALFNDKNLVFGNKNSKNLFVEIADPSCPYCHIAGGHDPELNKQVGSRFTMVSDGGTYIPPVIEMKKLVDENKAAFVYIYYPGHGNGEMGTKAMYCADEKGKFWPVHDKLMSNSGYALLNNDVKNDKTKSDILANFLSDVADSTEMKNCLDSGKYDSKLTEDISIASPLIMQGTPTFYINTTGYAGAYSWKDMQNAVES